MFFKANSLPPRNFGPRLVHIGFRPRQIISLLDGALVETLFDELTRGILDGRKIAAGDVGFEASLLLGGKSDGHASSIAWTEVFIDRIYFVHSAGQYPARQATQGAPRIN